MRELRTLKSLFILSVFAFSVQSALAADVTVNQKLGQADPSLTTPVLYTVVFSQPINILTFTITDIATTGSTATGITVDSITEVSPNDGTTFEVSVSATGEGDIVLSIPSGSVNYSSSILGTTGNNPVSITLDASGNVYTANLTSDTVTKITPAGVSSTLGSTHAGPVGILVDASGNVYTSNTSANNVTKITPAGVTTVFGTTGTYPVDLAMDTSGNIYTANTSSNNVSKITPAGVSTILGTTGTNPLSIVLDAAGNVYTANNSTNNVSKITPAGVSTILGTTGSSPYAITIDASGNIYTVNNGSNNVSKITPSGVSTILGTTGTGPQGITIDASDNIYTSNYTSNNVSKITPAGVSTILGTTGSNPIGVAVDASGNVYTDNYTANTVTKFTRSVVGITDSSGNANTVSTSTDNTITYQLLASSDTIHVALAVNGTISITAPADVTMGAITGTGQSDLATNFATWNIKTNNASGYSLAWQSSSAEMTNLTSDTIGAYTPAIANTPEPWTVAATDSEWGAHLSSTSTIVDTGLWGPGDAYTGFGSAGYWLNVDSVSPFTIVSSSSPTLISGDDETVFFGGEIGSSKIQPTGNYTVDVTMTATTL